MEAKETIWQLNDVAKELNALGDDATKKIKNVEALLEKMGVGVEVVLDEPFDGKWRLAFTKIDSEWRLAAVEITETETHVAPLGSCQRLTRIQAALHIDRLVTAILNKLKSQLDTARQALFVAVSKDLEARRAANGQQ